MELFLSSKKRNNQMVVTIQNRVYNNGDDHCFQEIKGLNPIKVKFAKGTKLLITLTVTDNWCDKAGDGAWFGIAVNKKIEARGLYTAGCNNQRVPITLQTLVEITDDPKEVEINAMWCNTAQGSTCYIGEWSEATLTVMAKSQSKSTTEAEKQIMDATKETMINILNK